MTALETDRLTLRQLTPYDAPIILALLNEPSFVQFVGDRNVRTLDDARTYILNGPVASYAQFGFGLYLTLLRASGDPIGICGLLKRDALSDVDVGFAFFPQFWGNGYAKESALAVIDHGRKSFGLTRIVAVVSPNNHVSRNVLEKLGFRFERLVRLSDGAPEIELFALDLDDD